MGFLAFLFWVFLAIYLLGIVSRWALRRMLMRGFRQQQAPPRPRRKEGEVSVEQVGTRKKQVDKQVGEYVDFEEVR